MTSTENKDPNRKDFFFMLIILSLFVIICHFVLSSCQVKKQHAEQMTSEEYIQREIQKALVQMREKEKKSTATLQTEEQSKEDETIVKEDFTLSPPDTLGFQYVERYTKTTKEKGKKAVTTSRLTSSERSHSQELARDSSLFVLKKTKQTQQESLSKEERSNSPSFFSWGIIIGFLLLLALFFALKRLRSHFFL